MGLAARDVRKSFAATSVLHRVEATPSTSLQPGTRSSAKPSNGRGLRGVLSLAYGSMHEQREVGPDRRGQRSQRRAKLAIAATTAALVTVATAPAQAARIVAIAPHLAELTCAAGACSQLVGRVAYSDYPAEVTKLPSIGDAFAINAEALLALKPDLVITWDGGTPAATLAQLQRLKLKTLSLRVNQLEDVETALITLGDQLGTSTEARKAAADYHARIETLRTRYASAKRLRVFYQIEADPIFTINRDSPISQALALCGGDNVFADLPQLAGALGREAVLQRDPDVVIWGDKDDVAGISSFWKRWPAAKATRAGNLYAVSSDKLARATPRMAEGAAELCAVLDQARAKTSAR